MKFKVHWIIDGIAEIEGESKQDAEKKLQETNLSDKEQYITSYKINSLKEISQ